MSDDIRAKTRPGGLISQAGGRFDKIVEVQAAVEWRRKE
jgi:hypothetical protein